MSNAEKLEEELRAAGAPTVTAEVVSAKEGRFTISHGASAADQVMTAHTNWKLTLRVMPDGAEPYEVDLKAPFPRMGGGPRVGQRMGVLVDPKDRDRVAIDHSPAGQLPMVMQHIPEATQAAMESVLGSSAEDLMAEALADPAAFREKMRSGVTPPVMMVGGQPFTVPAPGTPAPAPAPASAADELTKLADLRDRGVLTEDEFQEQKRKVLGG